MRDVIASCPRTFEVHKLEHIKAGLSVMGGEVVVGDKGIQAGVVMRIICNTEKEKEEWVRSINCEVSNFCSSSSLNNFLSDSGSTIEEYGKDPQQFISASAI